MERLQKVPADTLHEIASLLSLPLLQDPEERQDKPPAQPCGEEFKTKGRFRAIAKAAPNIAAALTAISNAFSDARVKAERFCALLSEDGCKKVAFVRYDFFDSDVEKKKKNKFLITVELVVVWKCTK